MSAADEILKALKQYMSGATGTGLHTTVQLPVEIVLRVQTLLQRQHSALQSAESLVDALAGHYDKAAYLERTIHAFTRVDTIRSNANTISAATATESEYARASASLAGSSRQIRNSGPGQFRDVSSAR